MGLWLLAFTVPKAYLMYQHRVNRVTGEAYKVARVCMGVALILFIPLCCQEAVGLPLRVFVSNAAQ
jgi:hypothetical protein